jgi:hypothetical protein
MNHGRQLRLFLADGTSSGPRFYEIVNRTIQALAIPANRIKDLTAGIWDETAKAGVYVVHGTTENADEWLYIGKGENVGQRVQSHPEKLDFDVTTVLLFTSKDENLNGSQVGWLESHLVRQAKEAKRIKVANKQTPAIPPLPKGEEATICEFLEDLQLIAHTANFSYFSTPKPKSAEPTGTTDTSSNLVSTDQDLVLNLPKLGITANGYRSDEGFVVRQGSQARAGTSPKFSGSYAALRTNLIDQGVITPSPSNDRLVFSVDYAFSSPSAASSVIVGGSSSGNIAWETPGGTPLGKLLELQATTAPQKSDQSSI